MSQIGKNLKTTILGSRKLLIFFGLVVVVVIGYVLSSSPEPNIVRSQVPGGLGKDVPVQGIAENTPAYTEDLDKSDADNLDKAKIAGTTAIPTLRANPTQTQTPVLVTPEPTPAVPLIEDVEPKITQQPILVQAPINNVPIVAPPNANGINDNKARIDGVAKYMAEMRRTIPTAQVTTFGDPSNFVKEEPQQSASVAEPTLSTASEQSRITLPLSGKILYAELVGRANSDVPGPVIAKVLQGDYAGATLIGSFKTAREHLVISFDKMTVEKTVSGEEINETVSINAVAVDTSNIGTGLATSVDRHLFQKLAIGFTSAFAQGLGDAIGDKGSTTYNTSNGTITTRNGDLNTEEQFLSAGGQAVARGGSILDSEFGNRPTTIIVEGGTAIGVLFL